MSIGLGINITCSMLLYLAFKSVLPHPFTGKGMCLVLCTGKASVFGLYLVLKGIWF